MKKKSTRIALAMTLITLIAMLASSAAAQTGPRAVAMISAGPADITAHLTAMWPPGPVTNVYLVDAKNDPAVAGLVNPPDGVVLAVEGCQLRRSTWDAIQRLRPNGVIGIGNICREVVEAAAGQEYVQPGS